MAERPDILFVMTDQQRFDTVAALGNRHIYTPNLDRLVRRGVSFDNAYSTCPVCIPARYTVRTGREPLTTGVFQNAQPKPGPGQVAAVEGRCGLYLPRYLRNLDYRTFGIGKFHTVPWNEELGYERQIHTREMWGSRKERLQDGYAAFIAAEHPEYDFIEQLHGERTDMYYVPQTSSLPAELTVEAWAAERAVEEIGKDDHRPYFGFVSFVGPHPPFAPPLPYNRMYDPDRMPNPVCGELATDHLDEQIPWMNYLIWAEDIAAPLARTLKARYYGEISYIDACLGRILDTVEEHGNAANTLICFFSDHGDLLGDHHGWQKECFFESACHVPFLVSWPARLPQDERRTELVCLTDLFGIAAAAAGAPELRDGVDVLGLLEGNAAPRKRLFGCYGDPGTPLFKIMVREQDWKYVFMANGGREQLFNLADDPEEKRELSRSEKETTARLRQAAVEALQAPPGKPALDGGDLRAFPFQARPLARIKQFDGSRGVTDFPKRPEEVLKNAAAAP